MSSLKAFQPHVRAATVNGDNDAESINRQLEDTLWLGRAHSVGHVRQHVNLLGYALMVNSLARHRHVRAHERTPLVA